MDELRKILDDTVVVEVPDGSVLVAALAWRRLKEAVGIQEAALGRLAERSVNVEAELTALKYRLEKLLAHSGNGNMPLPGGPS